MLGCAGACTCMILHARFTCSCRAERVDWLSSRSIAPPRLRPWVNACDRHPIAMPPRKPLYILVGMFYNPWKDTLEPVRTAETDAMCESTPLAIPTPCFEPVSEWIWHEGHFSCLILVINALFPPFAQIDSFLFSTIFWFFFFFRKLFRKDRYKFILD